VADQFFTKFNIRRRLVDMGALLGENYWAELLAVSVTIPSGPITPANPLPVVQEGVIAASDTTDTLYNSTTGYLTPKFSTIIASASGATTIVALVASKRIRVLSLQLLANAAVNIKWQSHVTPTDLTGLAYMAANGGYVLGYNPKGWFQTVAGEALDINLSGAVAVGGSLTYVEI